MLTLSFSVKAQFYTHDIGFSVGESSIQADYGERDNFASIYENKGLTFTLAHYLTFYQRNRRWNSRNNIYNNLAMKSEISYTKFTDIRHFGKWVEQDTQLATLLEGMRGSSTIYSVGSSAEYYFRNIRAFADPYSEYNFNPYFSLGGRFVYFENGLESSLGDWRTDNTVLPQKYRPEGATSIGSGIVFSIVASVGLRYKLTNTLDLNLQLSAQTFFSDKVDGLTADVVENKFDEHLVNYQVGITYHLNYFYALFN